MERMRNVDEIDWAAANKGLAKMGDAIISFGNDVAKAMEPVIKSMWEILHQRYLDAGAPYGDTHDGMMRWYQEEAAYIRAVDKYREQVAWRKSLAELRERFRG